MSMHALPNKIIHLHFYFKYINLRVSEDQFTPTINSLQLHFHEPTSPMMAIPNKIEFTCQHIPNDPKHINKKTQLLKEPKQNLKFSNM